MHFPLHAKLILCFIIVSIYIAYIEYRSWPKEAAIIITETTSVHQQAF